LAATALMFVSRSRTELKSLFKSSAIFCACISRRLASSLFRASFERRTSSALTFRAWSR
jgi:hypothetical protein